MSYTWEKTYAAVLMLANGTSSLQSRLADAYIGALMRLKREDFPIMLRDNFDAIAEAYHQVSDPVIGSAKASMNTLDEIQAEELATKILSLYSAIVIHEADQLRDIFFDESE